MNTEELDARVHIANSELFECGEPQLAAANADWNRGASAFGALLTPATNIYSRLNLRNVNVGI
jgi:hypothetical protein